MRPGRSYGNKIGPQQNNGRRLNAISRADSTLGKLPLVRRVKLLFLAWPLPCLLPCRTVPGRAVSSAYVRPLSPTIVNGRFETEPLFCNDKITTTTEMQKMQNENEENQRGKLMERWSV